MDRFGDEHPTSIAGLRGRRFVPCSETKRDKYLDEARVKNLTGDESITARLMHRDFFDFMPVFKLLLITNAKPVISGVDHGIWRRVHLMPWNATATQPDVRLKERLREELAGILRWAVEGCLRWREEGLGETTAMRAAKGAYRESMDQIGTWLYERCELGPTLRVGSSLLYQSYRSWALDRGEKPYSQKSLTQLLVDRGFKQVKNNTMFFLGVDVRLHQD
jgi:putative DNA primase/helicase